MNERSKANFAVNPKLETRILHDFDIGSLALLKNANLELHLRRFGTPLWAFKASKALTNMFKVISAEYIDGEYVVTMSEAYNYPFYTMIFHPEFLYDKIDSINAMRTSQNFRVSQQFSLFFAKEARKNSHQFDDEEELRQSVVEVYPFEFYGFVTKIYTGAYGFKPLSSELCLLTNLG